MKRKILITIAGGVFAFGIMLSPKINLDHSDSNISIESLKIMAMAYADTLPCDPVTMTQAEYLECSGCVAVPYDRDCVGNGNLTYTWSDPPEEPYEN